MDKAQQAADIIGHARLARTPLQPLPEDIAPRSEAEGYRVQSALHVMLAGKLGAIAGYKIGCTSTVMQKYLNIPHPCAGGMFAHEIRDSGAVLRHRDFVRAGIECEIAVRLGRDLGPGDEDEHSIAAAIDAYMPSIEIVDDRYSHWESIGSPTLIADDFFSAGCVLGAAVSRAKVTDPAAIAGRVSINGVEVARGTGADVLGHPHRALAWLAKHLAAQNTPLRAGTIVTTGSMVQTVWINGADSVEITLDGLGHAAVTFGA